MASTLHDVWTLPLRSQYGSGCEGSQEMERRGLDLLYVTSPPNLYYLTGYSSVLVRRAQPTGPAIALDARHLSCVTPGTTSRNWPATITDGITYGEQGFYYPGALDEVVSALAGARAGSRSRGTRAVELGARWARPRRARPAYRERRTNAMVIDGSFVVDHVRLLKSPRELEYTRRALAIADRAHEAVRDALRPGVTETELMGLYYAVVGRLGGNEPAIRMMVHSGPNSNHFHAPASERAIEAGELLMVDMSACYRHYHGNTARAFSIGANPFWDNALRELEAGLYETTARIKPGDPAMKLQRLMDDYVDRVGLRDWVWWVGGYVLGATMPPDWVGHVYLSDEEGFEPGVFDPGFVANWEIQLEDIPAHQGVGLIETMIMTDKGIDLPATFQRTLSVV